jgi:ABC-type lipoprotein export system ATPase subunit
MSTITNVNTVTIAEAQGITKDYIAKGGVVHALRGLDLRIQPGELVALQGRSGSGKTTLINILTGLDDPTTGHVQVLNHDLSTLNNDRRARLRREQIGILFQSAHLFPNMTAEENIEVPLLFAKVEYEQRLQMVHEALVRVGLAERGHHRSMELSGGEQQRVALARALVHKPRFIVADEPTGNLDPLTGQTIIKLLSSIAHDTQAGLLIATHDPHIVEIADRVLRIQDGQIQQVEPGS